MEKIELKYKKLNPNAIEPFKGSEYAAGLDLHACIDEDIRIHPNCTIKIPTGIAIDFPEGTFGMIVPRSGLSTKEDLANINAPGIADEDYTGEIIVALHNYGGQIRVVHPGERIAQILIMPYYACSKLIEVNQLKDSKRGSNAFGSSGLF